MYAAQSGSSSSKSIQCGFQVTRLVVCIRKPRDVLYKQADMAVLACIVVACSARLESLDLSLGSSRFSSANNPCAQHLLVRPLCISGCLYCFALGGAW